MNVALTGRRECQLLKLFQRLETMTVNKNKNEDKNKINVAKKSCCIPDKNALCFRQETRLVSLFDPGYCQEIKAMLLHF